MDIPPELVDEIIEEIHPYDDRGHGEGEGSVTTEESALILQTLQSCALVSRAFTGPTQMRIFSMVGLLKKSHCERFSQLLLDRPHISAYVRHLQVGYTLNDAGPLSIILSRLPKLETAYFNVATYWRNSKWSAHPAPLKAAFLVALSCPTLRRVTMLHYRFDNAWELHDLLRNATGLKYLVLENIQFSNREIASAETTSTYRPKILLDTLGLRGLTSEDVDCLISTFNTVDFTHLRSLNLANAAPTSLLRANAPSLQTINISLDSQG